MVAALLLFEDQESCTSPKHHSQRELSCFAAETKPLLRLLRNMRAPLFEVAESLGLQYLRCYCNCCNRQVLAESLLLRRWCRNTSSWTWLPQREPQVWVAFLKAVADATAWKAVELYSVVETSCHNRKEPREPPLVAEGALHHHYAAAL